MIIRTLSFEPACSIRWINQGQIVSGACLPNQRNLFLFSPRFPFAYQVSIEFVVIHSDSSLLFHLHFQKRRNSFESIQK